MMHLTGCFAYLSVCLPTMALVRPWMLACMGVSLVCNINGRAGLVAFACGGLIVMILRPLNKLALGTAAIAAVGLGALWMTGLKIELPLSGRYLSFEQFTENINSITGETQRDELDGSKRWRLEWWNTIIDYTFDGPYFWTGKGFGINLANADGFQVHADNALRSPHNGHLTILARAGVPGFALWIATQLAWGLMVFDAFIRAVRAREKRWSGMFVFLMAYWAAFMVNISFDVFLEGPVGGIWFWTLFGVGLAAVRIHRTAPEVMKDGPDDAAVVRRPAKPRFRRPNVRTLPAPAPAPRKPVRALLP
jgi:O-antigen ligase